MEVKLTLADLIDFGFRISDFGFVQRDRFGFGVGVAEVNDAQRVREIVGHISRMAGDGDRARAKIACGQFDTPAGTREEWNRIPHRLAFCISRASRLEGVERRRQLQQLLQQGREVNQTQFVRAGVGDEQSRAIGRPSHPPRIRRPSATIVQQGGGQNLHPAKINHCQGVGIHPQGAQVACGGPVLRQDMGDGSILAIRRNAYVLKRAAAVRQQEFGGHLALGQVNSADHCRHVSRVGRLVV